MACLAPGQTPVPYTGTEGGDPLFLGVTPLLYKWALREAETVAPCLLGPSWVELRAGAGAFKPPVALACPACGGASALWVQGGPSLLATLAWNRASAIKYWGGCEMRAACLSQGETIAPDGALTGERTSIFLATPAQKRGPRVAFPEHGAVGGEGLGRSWLKGHRCWLSLYFIDFLEWLFLHLLYVLRTIVRDF